MPEKEIRRAIPLIRRQPVLRDEDLARLYGVETRVLNQAVTRNLERFPDDFMFVLTKDEWEASRSPTVTSKADSSGIPAGPDVAPR